MPNPLHDQVADALLGAYASGVPISPLQDKFGPLTIDDAYAIQLRQVDSWLASGRRILGHKVGLTSAAMQRQLGVNRPDFGHLTDTMFFAENAPIDFEAFLQPRIEPEVAFVLKRSLTGPGVTVAAAVAAVDFVLPAWRSSTRASPTGRSASSTQSLTTRRRAAWSSAAGRSGWPM